MTWNIKDDSRAIEETEAQWRARQEALEDELNGEVLWRAARRRDVLFRRCCSPALRAGVRAAAHELHRAAWEIAQEPIALDDAETIVARVLLAYEGALAARRS